MRVIGFDVSRTVAEIAFLEHGKIRSGGRIAVERSSLQRFGQNLRATDHLVLEATGNTAAISETLKPYVDRAIVANPPCKSA